MYRNKEIFTSYAEQWGRNVMYIQYMYNDNGTIIYFNHTVCLTYVTDIYEVIKHIHITYQIHIYMCSTLDKTFIHLPKSLTTSRITLVYAHPEI